MPSGQPPDKKREIVEGFAQAIAQYVSGDDAMELGALKEFTIPGDDRQEEEKAVGRLTREIECLRDVNEPGILKLLDADADARWMVTEYHPTTLAKQIQKYKGKALEALQAFRPLVVAVAALHARNIIHRDIKPENVFVSRDGDLDFRVGTVRTSTSSPTIRRSRKATSEPT